LADFVAVPQDWLVRAPKTLDFAEASTLVVAGLTAWFALVERGRLCAGEIVLVEGTGGVGLFGLLIAKAHGAEVIVSASADHLARVRTIGADHAIDRRREDWIEAVLGATDDHGADHILELVGGPHLGEAVKVAAVGGRIYQIGALAGWTVEAPVEPILFKDITIHGIGTGHRTALEDLVRAVDRSGMKPVIDRRYPLAKLAAAMDHLDAGSFGKVVVELS
jgi:NADPH:quinone reductase-like Zn-dependent oxidoreductase